MNRARGYVILGAGYENMEYWRNGVLEYRQEDAYIEQVQDMGNGIK